MARTVYCFLVAFLLLLAGLACAQSGKASLTGRVTDARTGEALAFANVFLANTTLGVTTDQNGLYSLNNLPLGTVDVAASYLGYSLFSKSIRLENAPPVTLDIALTPSQVVLEAVEVKARENKEWQRQLGRFSREFIGNTPFARQCHLLNPQVLSFSQEKGTFAAAAAEPLKIENRALGYQVTIFLDTFLIKGGITRYAGLPRFSELKPRDEKEKAGWVENRKTAYYASTRYLLKLLLEGRWEQAGFLVLEIKPALLPRGAANHSLLYPNIGKGFVPFNLVKSVSAGKLPFERRIVLRNPLEVFNTRKASRETPYRDAPYSYGRLTLPRGVLDVTADGWVYQPTDLEVTGFLARDRVAHMLPREYSPDGVDPVTEAPAGGAAPAAVPLFDTLAHRLTKLPNQKVYLHLDKAYYWSGNSLRMGAYLTDATTGRGYEDPQLLHVELLSPAGKPVGNVKLRATAGRAAGQLHLPDTVSTGVYRLRAYTNWMQKTTGSYLYDQPLVVYNLKNPRFGAAAKRDGNPAGLRVQFYPEGGPPVLELTGRMAFRVTDAGGRGLAVTGRVLDDRQNEVSPLSTNEAGLGSLLFKPEPGRQYTAEFFGSYAGASFPLPVAQPEGFVLLVDNLKDGQIYVRAKGSAAVQEDSLWIVVQTRNVIFHSGAIKLKGGLGDTQIPKAKFSPGVCRLTLFDRQGKPRCERLLFIERPPLPLRVQVQPLTPTFAAREPVEMEVVVTDTSGTPVQGTFSLAITDAGQHVRHPFNHTLISNQLLTAELPGYVDSPNQFLLQSDGNRESLDLLLLTQSPGWLPWKEVLSTQQPFPPFLDHFLGVRGKVLSRQGNKPIGNCRVVMIPVDSTYRLTHSTHVRPDGTFRFEGLEFLDTISVIIQTLDYNGKPVDARIELEKPQSPPIRTPSYPAGYLLQQPQSEARAAQTLQARQYAANNLNQVQVLKEVVVKERRSGPQSAASANKLYGPADNVITFDEKSPQFTNLYEMVQGRVPGVQVLRNKHGGYTITIRGPSPVYSSHTQPLFLLDGIPIQDDSTGQVLMSFNPNDIARIEVLKGATASIFGVRGASGVIAFYTKGGTGAGGPGERRPGMHTFRVIGYQGASRPDDPAAGASRGTDYRDVLYWNPVLETDAEGKARVMFYNSDIAGSFQVVLEGITAAGQPVTHMQLVESKPK
jgi:hypothetical protein